MFARLYRRWLQRRRERYANLSEDERGEIDRFRDRGPLGAPGAVPPGLRERGRR